MPVGQLDGFLLQGKASGLDIGEFQYVADLGMQILAGFGDVVGIFAIFGMAWRTEQAVGDDFGKADHRVQRRTQFMAHMGDEFRFGAQRLHRAAFGIGQPHHQPGLDGPRGFERPDGARGLGLALEAAHEQGRQPGTGQRRAQNDERHRAAGRWPSLAA